MTQGWSHTIVLDKYVVRIKNARKALKEGGGINMTQDYESTLIMRFKHGDQNAYCGLFEAHQGRIMHIALQILRNEEAALDVAQDVFMRAYEILGQWRGDARFSTWLYRTALNVCYERIRAEDRQRKIRDRMPAMALANSPEVDLLSNDILRAIDRAVESLPPRQREIFALKHYEGMRFLEIASLLEITSGSVKSSYHKAVVALRDRLKDFAPARGKVEAALPIEEEADLVSA